MDASAVVHADGGDLPCTVGDLSRSGVRLASPLPASLDRILDLTLRGGGSEPELRVRARPARRTSGPEGRGVAFEFLDLAPEQERGLSRLIESGLIRIPAPEATLDALRHDAHPAVLDALARNPQLTAVEARALAASPYLSAATLESLAADTRWNRDEELRLAIAASPRAPEPLADRLVAELGAERARRLLRLPGLAPRLRERLSRRVARGH